MIERVETFNDVIHRQFDRRLLKTTRSYFYGLSASFKIIVVYNYQLFTILTIVY
jgi:hypothetical protein